MATSASTWGDPTATQRVLLLHGITRSSQFWHPVAQDFASRGYFVVAPDLLGHGLAKRSSTYTIAAFVDALQPWLTLPKGNDIDRSFDIVVGHSLGGIVTAALTPLLASSHKPISVVLVDPPLELTPEAVAAYRVTFVDMVSRPHTPEAVKEENPLWSEEDAVIASLSMRLCDVAAVEGVLDQNVPWSFSHYLKSIPDNVRMSVLAADPSKWCCVAEAQLEPYPHVAVQTVWGASHVIPLERPEVVVEAALGTLKKVEREEVAE